MANILVTGGAGYIGSHTCRELARAGHALTVYDNLSRGNRPAVRWGELVEGDLRQADRLAQVIRERRIETVIHFAALAYVRESFERPEAYWANNVEGTRSLLEAMAAGGARRIIFSSSCATYGVPEELPIRLDSPQAPINPYGRTKLVCEWMMRDLAPTLGFDYVFLRYFNVAGGDPEGEIGEVHEPETHILPILLLKAASGDDAPVRIYGNTHPTPDGTCVRDFIHVVDLARVHGAALDYLAKGGDSRAFNVGLGHGTSLMELVEACRRVTGAPIPTEVAEAHPGDPPSLVADPGDTWDVLALKPHYPAIDTMIEHAWAWLKGGRARWLAERSD